MIREWCRVHTACPHSVVSNSPSRLARLLHNTDHHAGIDVARFHIWILLPWQSSGALHHGGFEPIRHGAMVCCKLEKIFDYCMVEGHADEHSPLHIMNRKTRDDVRIQDEACHKFRALGGNIPSQESARRTSKFRCVLSC